MTHGAMSPSGRRPTTGSPSTLMLFLLAATVSLVAAQGDGNETLDDPRYLTLLLVKLGEPLYYDTRGHDGDVSFNLPEKYKPERYQATVTTQSLRTGATAEEVDIPLISSPDISLPRQLGRRDHFSLFVPYHQKMAKRLIEIFLEANSLEEFISVSAFCREALNPYLFAYAFSVALLHRNDTAGAQLPPLHSIFPEKYFDRAVFPVARRESNLAEPEERLPIEIPMEWTATDVEPEHRVAYFREDVGMNMNHWSWHIVYPFDGTRELVDKDRRGELFYYFHRQIIARYNFERFCNNLPRAGRYRNFRQRVREAYFSKLTNLLASRSWASRAADMPLSDLKRADFGIFINITTMESWRDRIIQAVQAGRMEASNGSIIILDEVSGIDILGNTVEASPLLTINENLYGDLHNMGHVFFGLCHDPDHRHLETFSVIGDPTTAMRDPIFYRWHSFIDDIFNMHKQMLTPYTVQQLDFNDIQVTDVRVQSQGVNDSNLFITYWQQTDLNLADGLDFVPRGPVLVRVTHLQHTPFSYRIQVVNNGARRRGTVRIFLAPQFNEHGRRFTFRDQRLFFIEMDKFQHTFRQGTNTIVRQSVNSSVTVPFERTFRNFTADLSQPTETREQLNYCGCGWPQHMLVPKGTTEGMGALLFVMVSNYADDRVNGSQQPNRCSQGHSICGIFKQRYPDRRSMGYPFDRQPRAGVDTLRQFLTPNMKVTPVTIRFTGETQRPDNTETMYVGPSNQTQPSNSTTT